MYGSEEIDWEAEAAPSNLDLLIMMMDQSELITGPEELRLWERCGAIIGECLLPTSCLVSAWRWEGPQQGYDALVAEFQQLTQTGDYSFLAEYVDRLTGLDFQSVWQAGERRHAHVERQVRRLEELDAGLRRALRTQTPPEVWLDLDRDRLIFLGARYYLDRLSAGKKDQDYLDRLPRAEAAFLWVLADRPGEWVSRKVLKEEGELARSERDLDWVATPLRNMLRKAIKPFFAKWGGTLPEIAQMGFIEGKRDKSPHGGPYILRLDPIRVRVSGPRPDGMGPRLDD